MGSLRLSLNGVRGFDFDGGHVERRGLSPTGEVVDVPLHRHRVSLDFTRLELNLQYTFRANWDIWFRTPYDIKDQRADLDIVESASDSQIEAIQANRDIHHRGETYTGFADLSFLMSHRKSNILSDNDSLVVALGTSIPTGQTESDPFKAGKSGRKHLHIQFGTGTFDPLAELYYSVRFPPNLSLNVFALGRFPFDENKKTYRGPVELNYSVRVGHSVVDWLAFHTSYLALYQHYAYWDGIRDINSGLMMNAILLGSTVSAGKGITLRLDVMFPLSQRTLSDEGDTFEKGPTVFSTISRSF